ncbi:MAG: hypothetical protein ACEQSR_12380 [Candidatus Methylacidiphilales bacterium]
MKLPVIKQLVELYTLEQLQKAEEQMLNEEPISIEVLGDDEGEQLTHILGAIDVLERVKNENKDKSTALREFFQRVRNSIS